MEVRDLEALQQIRELIMTLEYDLESVSTESEPNNIGDRDYKTDFTIKFSRIHIKSHPISPDNRSPLSDTSR